MKSKFVRLLIVINGILLFPILIFLLFELVNDKFKKDSNEFLEYETPIVKESIEENNDYKIRFSSVIKIPNSENYIVAEYKDLGNNAILEREIELPYSVPTFTYNLIFLDKNFDEIGKLLKNEASIKSMHIPNAYSNKNEEIKEIKYLSFYIATEDSNEDGEINSSDQHYVYISDLNGKNLIRLSDRKVKQYQWINNSTEILLTFEDEINSGKLDLGVYDLKTKTLRNTKNLN
ncbi:hypothetical protein M4I21_17570 [Cellulophaga sp. 20_2_10]|uniref:hypothetical protein n=1 Tax=Cellulophaga sp. 20_2_10 TaxID=2942476 RepID=UPI00201AF2A2|nr:hypothetical protein [Cellulophaga sp. 20_2_10]MCL5247631.1 hypothetical protein [Cellulophaga sp. 20_2_10]